MMSKIYFQAKNTLKNNCYYNTKNPTSFGRSTQDLARTFQIIFYNFFHQNNIILSFLKNETILFQVFLKKKH
jgi:hypothetical protein